MWEFVFGGIRVQLLSGRIVRVERMKKGKFCDASTFFIPDRTQFKGYDGEARQEEDRARVLFGGYELVLPLGGRSLSGVRLERDGKTVFYALADDHVRTIIGQGMDHITEDE